MNNNIYLVESFLRAIATAEGQERRMLQFIKIKEPNSKPRSIIMCFTVFLQVNHKIFPKGLTFTINERHLRACVKANKQKKTPKGIFIMCFI